MYSWQAEEQPGPSRGDCPHGQATAGREITSCFTYFKLFASELFFKISHPQGRESKSFSFLTGKGKGQLEQLDGAPFCSGDGDPCCRRWPWMGGEELTAGG